MNQIATANKLGAQVSLTSGDGGFSVTPQTLSDIVEFAKFMSLSNAGIPSYLRGNAPDCAAITMQALKWGFDPFSVAQKSYKVKDVLAYEAQLIAAVINARSGIKGRLKYLFEGEGADLVCTVTGTLDGDECVYSSPRVGNITTKNSPLWKTDPEQQLGYYSARNWARRHCPEVILGAYDRDEAEEFRGPDNARDVTPTPSVMERLQAAQSAPERTADAVEGFSAAHVQRETASVLTGEIFTSDTDDALSLPASGSDDESAPPPSSTEDAVDPSPKQTVAASSPPKFSFADGELMHLKDFARKSLKQASDTEISIPARMFDLEGMEQGYRGEAITSDDGLGALDAMIIAINAVINGKRTKEQSAAYIARELLDCDPTELEGRP